MSKSVLPMICSRNCMVSCLKFRSLIHFEFIFVYGFRECSNFILLHIAVQFSQCYLLKRRSFLHWIFLSPYHKLTISVWVNFWALYSVPLTHVSFFVLVPYCLDSCSFVVYFQVRNMIPSTLFFFLKIAVAIRGLCVSIQIFKLLDFVL